ncbi:MAG TPA: HNH endonuclease, partial [Blastocatellia bacterium]|nr:HNH endonuclease [Blastocatellia bacterium]
QDAPVSRIMQRVLTSYSQYHNRKYKKIGHVFQGRYKSILCQSDRYLGLWISQGGLCTLCGHKITRTTGWRSHKVVWRVFGGSDSMSNRVLLHPKCHSKVHDRELKVVEPRLVKEALTEA